MTLSALEAAIEEMPDVKLGMQLPLKDWHSMYRTLCDCVSVFDKIENGSVYKEKRDHMQALKKSASHYNGLLKSMLNRASNTDNQEKSN